MLLQITKIKIIPLFLHHQLVHGFCRKNILLPFDLQQAMAVEAEATRIAKAKLIEASGEIQAAVNLREASRIIMENPQIMLVNDKVFVT